MTTLLVIKFKDGCTLRELADRVHLNVKEDYLDLYLDKTPEPTSFEFNQIEEIKTVLVEDDKAIELCFPTEREHEANQ